MSLRRRADSHVPPPPPSQESKNGFKFLIPKATAKAVISGLHVFVIPPSLIHSEQKRKRESQSEDLPAKRLRTSQTFQIPYSFDFLSDFDMDVNVYISEPPRGISR